MEEIQFDIIDYVANALTGFTFTRKQVTYIVLARGLQDVTDLAELTQRDKDLLTADCLRIIYTTPSQTGNNSWSHGDATETQGGIGITDKRQLYQYMVGLYKKWGEDPFPDDMDGCVYAYNVLDEY